MSVSAVRSPSVSRPNFIPNKRTVLLRGSAAAGNKTH